MNTSADPETREFTKQAGNAEETDRLRREARVLAAAGHPGVVQLRSFDGRTLRQVLVPGTPLSDLVPSPADAARVALSIATTLADLHECGVTHGALSADHILVPPSCGAVLCSFGRGDATGGRPPPEEAKAADVVALAVTLFATGALPDPLARVLAPIAAGGRRTPSARRVANRLGDALAGFEARSRCSRTASVEVPVGARPPFWRRQNALSRVHAAPVCQSSAIREPLPAASAARSRPRVARTRIGPRWWVVAAVATAGIMLVSLALAARHRFTHTAEATPPTTLHHEEVTGGSPVSTCPPVDLGCLPLQVDGGVLATAGGRYRIGSPGDVIVVGRWDCSDALPALLQPGSGEVWAWQAWATSDQPSSARLVARIAGAYSLRVGRGARGCDFLQVLKQGGGTVAIDAVKSA